MIVLIIVCQLYELNFIIYVAIVLNYLDINRSDFLVIFEKILWEHGEDGISRYLLDVIISLLGWEMNDRNCIAGFILRKMR